MRVLWLCNINMDPDKNAGVGGGWILGLLSAFKSQKDINLGICYCGNKGDDPHNKENGGVKYYSFIKKIWNPEKYDASIESRLREILDDFNPDIVHIFGTEFPHSLAMVRVFNKPARTVIHIQGLVSYIAKHYTLGLTDKECKKKTFRDWLRFDSIYRQQRSFEQRGKWEIEAIRSVNHIFGRTTWDKACVMQINPSANYHYCSEALRDVFYEGQWEYEKCNKHSIFMSQGSYPVKGGHLAIDALSIVKKTYPDVVLYIAGEDMLSKGWRESSYSAILRRKIIKNQLQENVIFVGPQNADGMKKQLLGANVFVSASTIENSPNSIGEALVLGVPVVASDVGGVSDMVKHGEAGYLYPADEPYMLAHYVMEVFEKDNRLTDKDLHMREDEIIRHDRKNIASVLERVYSLCMLNE